MRIRSALVAITLVIVNCNSPSKGTAATFFLTRPAAFGAVEWTDESEWTPEGVPGAGDIVGFVRVGQSPRFNEQEAWSRHSLELSQLQSSDTSAFVSVHGDLDVDYLSATSNGALFIRRPALEEENLPEGRMIFGPISTESLGRVLITSYLSRGDIEEFGSPKAESLLSIPAYVSFDRVTAMGSSTVIVDAAEVVGGDLSASGNSLVVIRFC